MAIRCELIGITGFPITIVEVDAFFVVDVLARTFAVDGGVGKAVGTGFRSASAVDVFRGDGLVDPVLRVVPMCRGNRGGRVGQVSAEHVVRGDGFENVMPLAVL